jgi:hypothetical protein
VYHDCKTAVLSELVVASGGRADVGPAVLHGNQDGQVICFGIILVDLEDGQIVVVRMVTARRVGQHMDVELVGSLLAEGVAQGAPSVGIDSLGVEVS